jgi:hypothetical protein
MWIWASLASKKEDRRRPKRIRHVPATTSMANLITFTVAELTLDASLFNYSFFLININVLVSVGFSCESIGDYR